MGRNRTHLVLRFQASRCGAEPGHGSTVARVCASSIRLRRDPRGSLHEPGPALRWARFVRTRWRGLEQPCFFRRRIRSLLRPHVPGGASFASRGSPSSSCGVGTMTGSIRPKYPMGKVGRTFFENVIARHLGARRQDVDVGPASGVDIGVVRLPDGRALLSTTDPIYIVPQYGWERAAWFAFHILASDLTTSGVAPKDGWVTANMARPGNHLLVTKTAALEATAILSNTFPDLVERSLGTDATKRARALFESMSTVDDALAAASVGLRNDGVWAMHDATEGGVRNAVWEMAQASGIGVDVDLTSVHLDA